MAPQIPSSAIFREELVHRLDEATTSRVTHIAAPAGYGKSVLLAQWSARATGAVTWMNIDKRHNDVVQFARAFVECLQCVNADVGRTGLQRLDTSGDSLGDDFVSSLEDDLWLLPDTVVVLDSFESIRQGGVLADLATIIDHGPPHVHFIVATRSDAGIGLNRLRVRGELSELRRSDLAMSVVEASQLIRRVARVELSAAAVQSLVRRTEGWPAGLHLAALSLRGRADPEAFVIAFSGDDGHVTDYLTDEVLAQQPEEIRRFLLETSVLDRMNGPLCDAVTGRDDSQRLLQRLERSAMLIVRLDQSRSWFRYHPVLHDLLRCELQATDPDKVRPLLTLAADWQIAHDDLVAAGQSFIALGDWDLLMGLISRHGRSLFERGESNLLLEWVTSIPDAWRRSHIDASLSWAIVMMIAGRTLIADDELTRLLEGRALSPWQEATAEAIRGMMLQHHQTPERSIASADRVLECLEQIDACTETVDAMGLSSVASLRCVARFTLGRAAELVGCRDDARRTLTECLDDPEATYPVWRAHAGGSLALIQALDGELIDASVLASRVIEMAAEIPDHPSIADGYLALAVAARERTDFGAASIALGEAQQRFAVNRRLVALSAHSAEVAWLALAQGQIDDGLEIVAGVRTVASAPPPPSTAARLAAVEAQLHLATGSTANAQRILANYSGTRTADIAFAEIGVAVSMHDVAAARVLLGSLPADDCRRARLQQALWTAVVDDLQGDVEMARLHMKRAVAEGESVGMIQALLDAKAHALPLLRALYDDEPTPFLRTVVERAPAPAPTRADARSPMDQLTDREIIVLRYLPSRLSNPEIARKLYVSVNTLKTHLKHIYKKLDVTDRSAAIARGEALRLL